MMNEEDEIIEMVTTALPVLVQQQAEPVPKRTSMRTGVMYYRELMNENRNSTRFVELARMEKGTFNQLVYECQRIIQSASFSTSKCC